jgi:predicted O-methyltransferase YrrM
MYDGNPQLGVDAKMYPLAENVGIGPQQGMLIYQFVRDSKPENTLEIGLAYGFSTVYFLAAIRANRKGHHVAVDPFQDDWSGIGVAREKVLGCQPGTFEFSDQTPVQALARFARERRRFGLIFIDSDHKFDGVLVDFTLAALICEPGGHIILDDMHMPAIQRAVAFIRRNRPDFTELPTSDKRLSIFRMTDTDQRKWDHFVPF